MTLPISAIILTNTNDHLFAKTVASLAAFAELVVVTNGIHIPKKNIVHKNVNVVSYHNTPITDFATARNKAAQYATHDWVFFIDSDEVLEPFTPQVLASLIATTPAVGLSIIRKDVFLGKTMRYGEVGAQKLVRLINKKVVHFDGIVHEVAQVPGDIVAAPLTLKHYAHDSISSFIRDVTNYATIIGKQTHQHSLLTLFQLLIYPPTKFFYLFIFKQGFRDGYRGLVYALVMSLHSLIVRVTIYEKNTY